MVARLEKEVTEQQKCFVGILQGLRVDFRYKTCTTKYKHNEDVRLRKIFRFLNNINSLK